VYNAKEHGMANQDELELDVKATKSGGKGKIIMLIAAIMLLTTGSIIGVLYFMGLLGSNSNSADKPADKTAAKKELAIKPAFYLSLQPAFVVNFEDQSHASYLQVEMQVMARSKDVLEEVSANMPVIRNNILFILSAQKYEQVSTRAGKEQLQKTIVEAIQKVVTDAAKQKFAAEHKGKEKPKDATTKPENVEQIYFTSFIMQ
jgi:flagellar FliL protein